MALVPKYNIGKRPRRESSDDYSIEEISTDDMGYDADVEVLRPDQYEEPDSDFEDDQALRRLWPDTDDELSSKLRRLSCERPKTTKREDPRGRKRLSTEMEEEEERPSLGRTEIEVTEVVDHQVTQPPAKRRRQKTPLGHRVVKKQAQERWTDSSDISEDAAIESATSHGTPDATNAPPTPHRNGESNVDLDAMELG